MAMTLRTSEMPGTHSRLGLESTFLLIRTLQAAVTAHAHVVWLLLPTRETSIKSLALDRDPTNMTIYGVHEQVELSVLCLSLSNT